jgi:hypothetical protein
MEKCESCGDTGVSEISVDKRSGQVIRRSCDRCEKGRRRRKRLMYTIASSESALKRALEQQEKRRK